VPAEQRRVLHVSIKQNLIAGFKRRIGKVNAAERAAGGMRLHASDSAILAAVAFIGFNYDPLHNFSAPLIANSGRDAFAQ
jgi:hypothetical protein